MKKTAFIFFIFYSASTFGQQNNFQKLNKTITIYNDQFQYEKSIALLNNFLESDTITSYGNFEIYLLKAITYKRLFNYEEVFQNLKMAESEGLKSDKKEKVKNIIRAERAFAYYDIQNVDMGERLIQEVVKTNYKDLNVEQKIYALIMEATTLIGKRKMLDSENKLLDAQKIATKNCPRELPLVFAKKMVLYNKMNRNKELNNAFQLGVLYSKKHKILKYEMYMYEVMKYICIENNDNENLKFYQRKVDSLHNVYNAIIYNGKITLLEKKQITKKHHIEAQTEHKLTVSLIGLVILLIIVSFSLFQLYKKNRRSRKKVEEENRRIHTEIARLTAETNEKGETKIDLSKFELTERQMEIITLIKRGKTNKEIGNELFISENTVKYHLKVIYDILDIDHRSKLKETIS